MSTEIRHLFAVLFLLISAAGCAFAQRAHVIPKETIASYPIHSYENAIHYADSLKAAYDVQPFCISTSDSTLFEGGLGCLLHFYNQALDYRPGDAYATQQIALVNEQSREEYRQQAEVQYQKVIHAADKNFAEKNFDKALELYRRAVVFRPSDLYPANKIREIEAIMQHPE
jgi:hypothetical protein